MNVSHHLADETLQDYSAGVLSVPMETLIACHLTVCPACRQRSKLADNLGGIMLAQHESVPVDCSAEDLLKRAQVHNVCTKDVSIQPTDVLVKGVPKPLARLLPTSIDELKWRTFAPGMKQFNLSDMPRKQGAFKLISIDPGLAMGEHTHGHRELTYIVSGSYTDEVGQFKTGDIADLDNNDCHTPVVDADEPCICVIATDAPVQFSGLLGKIMQPFVGI